MRGLVRQKPRGTATIVCGGCCAAESVDMSSAEYLRTLDAFRVKHGTCSGDVVLRAPVGAEGDDLGLKGRHRWMKDTTRHCTKAACAARRAAPRKGAVK